MPSTEEAPCVCNRLRRTEPCTPSQRPDLTLAPRAKVVNGLDAPPSRPGRKADICCLSGGTGGVSPDRAGAKSG